MCQTPRVFEFQLTPQWLNYHPDLATVDWDTIAVYTCPSKTCTLDNEKGQFYSKEFAHMQLSADFEKVQYGTKEQVEQQKKKKLEEVKEELERQYREEPKSSEKTELSPEEEAARKKKAEKNKQKRERQKQKKKEA